MQPPPAFVSTASPINKLPAASCDVDHFKALNDSFGHAAGDAALREVGQVLREYLRAGDTLGRWGGEEFLALLPGADIGQALAAAEAVRAGLAARVFAIADGLHLTCSIGVAALPQHAQDWMALVDAADQAMYDAKRAGRNRVCAARAEGEQTNAAVSQAAGGFDASLPAPASGEPGQSVPPSGADESEAPAFHLAPEPLLIRAA